MRIQLTKYQRQSLGTAIYQGGLKPEDFIRTFEDSQGDEYGSMVLKERESGCRFTISDTNVRGRYRVKYDVPGLASTTNLGAITWQDTLTRLNNWVSSVKQENESSDPWEEEAEKMAEDDSYFTINELPKVDHAIDNALEELKTLAIKQGVKTAQIEAGIAETQSILKRTARNSTKREWITLFKAIIIEKLLDWGMATDVFHNILQILITSAHDITELTAHASRYLNP